MQYIAFDSHKDYTLARAEEQQATAQPKPASPMNAVPSRSFWPAASQTRRWRSKRWATGIGLGTKLRRPVVCRNWSMRICCGLIETDTSKRARR